VDRRGFLGTLAGSILAAPFVAGAQPAGRTVHIGVLSTGQPRSSPLYQASEGRLRELGYVDGRNATIHFRTAEGRLERIAPLTRELVRLKVDVLLTAGPEATIRAVKDAADVTPVVMIAVDFDPVASGHVASLAHPGGNMTGVTFRQLELAAKRLELLKEALPQATRVAVLWDAAAAEQLQSTRTSALTLGLQLESVELQDLPYDFDVAFRRIRRGRAEALLVLTTPVIFRERTRIADQATKGRLPTFFAFREHVEAGGLCSYGPNFSIMFRRAADYLDKILKGAKPAELPVEQPTKFELVINLKPAKALGLTIPPSLLQRADQVID
jgi:putative ABC transport system substrate-binding protein